LIPVKNKKLQKLKNDFVYYFTRFAIFLFNIIPRSASQIIGGALGYVAYRFCKKEWAIAHKTLGMVYGEKLNEPQREEIIRNLFMNFGKSLSDVIRFKKHYKRQIDGLIDVEGMEHFEKAYKRGKGVIAITGHIGNFEIFAPFFSYRGYKTAAIGREMYDKRMDKLLVENRQFTGLINIPTTAPPRKIMRVLKDGYVMAVVIDTDSMRVRSQFVPAFGKLSWTPVGQSILGLKAGAAFVPMVFVRNGKRYKLVIKPEVTIEPSGDFDKDVYNITKKCTEALEGLIDTYRDQWIWIHNRWHTRPVDEKEENTDIKQ